MSINILTQIPEANNLLVSFYDKHKLYALTGAHEEDSRSELASIMSEILELEASPNDQEIITDALMSVISQAERNLRQAIAQKMSVAHNAPLRLILNLASDEIDIATPVLKYSPVLNDTDLLYLVKGQSKEYWRVIAERGNLSPMLVDALADTRDMLTAKTLVFNKSSTLTDHALRVLSVMVDDDESLTKPLLNRKEMTQELITEIYNFVGYELQNYISSNFDIQTAQNFDIAMEEVKEEIIENTQDEFAVSQSMITESEVLLRNDMLNVHEMMNYLKRGQISTFIACFSTFCGLDIEVTKKLLAQEKGQGLAIACRAMGIQKTDFINIFLLTSRLRSNAMVQHTNLTQAIKYFDTISAEMAEGILFADRH